MWKAQDIAKKQHRERAQPKNRKKWGLLEKKKDYRLRAQDYHKKEAHLALLRTKAATRNEDEFDFKMINSKSKNGILIAERGNSALSDDAVKLLKTQDAGYIRSLVARERSQIEKAKPSLLVGDGKRTVFVENEHDMEGYKQNKKELLDGSPESVDVLDKRLARYEELAKVQQEIELQRELMKKGQKKRVVKDGVVSYKWKSVRKR